MNNPKMTEQTRLAIEHVLLRGWYLALESERPTGRPSRKKWTVCDKDGRIVAFGATAERAMFRAWEAYAFETIGA
jgi:hypothetical protein